MRERFYTTAELARICGVSISTIKRWTDAGLLRCVRTPGGHRKFRLQDVAEAARQLDTSMALPETPAAASLDALSLMLLQRNPQRLVAHLADALTRGDQAGVGRWLVDLHRHGLPVHTIAGEVLLGALAAVGGAAGGFVPLRAARIAENGVRHLGAQLPPPLPAAPRALLAGGSESAASLWLAIGDVALASAGWERVDLGPAVPAATIHAGLAAVQPELLVLAASRLPEAATAEDALASLPAACRASGVVFRLFPGGEAPSAALAALPERAGYEQRFSAAGAAAETIRPRREFT